MSAKSQIEPSKIRTFAGDLEAERQRQHLSAPDKTTAAPVPTPPKEKSKPTLKQATAKIVSDSGKKQEKESATKQGPNIVVPKKKENEPTVKNKPHIVVPEKKEQPEITKKPTKIPAYHELVKQQSAHSTPKAAAPAPTKHRPNIGFDATVITDTKSGRFKLIPSIITSIKKWFKEQSIKRKKKKAPKYFVSDSSHRKGVIQEATSKSGALFTADNATLKEHIRKRKQQDHTEGGEGELEWSPYTEPGYALLESPDQTSNVTVAFKKQAQPEKLEVPTTVTPTPEPIPVVPEKPKSVEPAIIEPTAQVESQSKPVTSAPQWGTDTEITPTPEPAPIEVPASELVSEEPAPDTETAPSDEPLLDDEQTTPEEEVEVPEEEVEDDGVRPVNWADTNTLTVFVAAGLIGLVALGFTARTVYNYLNAEVPDPFIEQLPKETILPNARLVPITLTAENSNQTPSLLTTQAATTDSTITELVIVSPTGNEVTATYLFELLNFEMLQNLQQSITTVRFASQNQSEPVMVMQFIDIQTVKGGFLQWEAVLLDDVRPLYSNLPTDVGDLSFIDDTVDGIDVRVLRYEGETILMYGIIGESTAIVAPTHALFTQTLAHTTTP